MTALKDWPVGACDLKLAGAQNYKLATTSDTLLDTIILAEKPQERGSDRESVAARISATEEAQRQCVMQETAYRGITFRKRRTVGEAINLMLSVNRWKKTWNDFDNVSWEDQWELVRIPLTDEDGNLPQANRSQQAGQDPQEQVVSTGSLIFQDYVKDHPEYLETIRDKIVPRT